MRINSTVSTQGWKSHNGFNFELSPRYMNEAQKRTDLKSGKLLLLAEY